MKLGLGFAIERPCFTARYAAVEEKSAFVRWTGEDAQELKSEFKAQVQKLTCKRHAIYLHEGVNRGGWRARYAAQSVHQDAPR
jgi:hypothetical protein